jgi:hypothetical protein
VKYLWYFTWSYCKLGAVKLSHVWNIVTPYSMYLNALHTLIEDGLKLFKAARPLHLPGIIVYCFDETFRKFINFINCPLTEKVWDNPVYGTFNLYLPYAFFSVLYVLECITYFDRGRVEVIQSVPPIASVKFATAASFSLVSSGFSSSKYCVIYINKTQALKKA